MRLGGPDTRKVVDGPQNHVGELVVVLQFAEGEDVRLAPARMGLPDSLRLPDSVEDLPRCSGFH